MPEPTINIIKRHGFKCGTQRHVQVLRRAWSASAHQSFDLRPAVLNRREVRRISWQPQDLCLDRSHRLFNLARQMHRQIIQEQNIRGTQLRAENLIDIRIKAESINCALNTEWRKQPPANPNSRSKSLPCHDCAVRSRQLVLHAPLAHKLWSRPNESLFRR